MNIRSVLVTFFVLVISGNTYAQQGNLSYRSMPTINQTQNRFEVGLGLSAVTLKATAKIHDYYNDDDLSGESNSVHGSSVAVSGHYMNVSPGSFGFTAGGTFNSSRYKSEGETGKMSVLSVEGNLAYGFNSDLVGYAGLNISSMHFEQKNVEEDDININDKLDPAFGGQIGLEYFVNRNLSLGGSIAAYRNTWETSAFDIEVAVTAIQAQVNYLF